MQAQFLPSPSRFLVRAGHSFCQPIYHRELPAIAAVLGLGLVIALGVARGAMVYDDASLTPGITSLGLFWLTGVVAEARGAVRLAQGTKALAAFLLLAVLTAMASAVVATARAPLADPLLATADAMLFPWFDWRGAMLSLASHGLLLGRLSQIYVSLTWQPPLLIVILCAAGRTEATWRLLTCWAATLVVCLAVFAVAPAVDAYVYYGVPHEAMTRVLCLGAWRSSELLGHLRDGSLTLLGPAALDGIITMPSFHAAAAVLLAWGWWGLRWLRCPAIALNVAMFVSAVPIGGHYLVDLLAGALVAGGTILVLGRGRLE